MKIHMVRSGDQLSDLAKKYNVPVERIIEANADVDGDESLQEGKKVFIPTGKIPLAKMKNEQHPHSEEEASSPNYQQQQEQSAREYIQEAEESSSAMQVESSTFPSSSVQSYPYQTHDYSSASDPSANEWVPYIPAPTHPYAQYFEANPMFPSIPQMPVMTPHPFHLSGGMMPIPPMISGMHPYGYMDPANLMQMPFYSPYGYPSYPHAFSPDCTDCESSRMTMSNASSSMAMESTRPQVWRDKESSSVES